MAAAEDDDGGQKQQQQPSDIIPKTPPTAIGALLPRKGTEIVVAGQLVNANTRVVTFLDADGFSAYTGCPHPTQPSELAMDAPRFGVRRVQTQCVPNSRWTLQALQQQIHQLVVHYDACGTAQKCFKVLHHERGLSCHFIIDLDGVIYQTLDVRERAWHATVANDASVGVELSNVGCVPADESSSLLEAWYRAEDGELTPPPPSPPRTSEGEDDSSSSSPDKKIKKRTPLRSAQSKPVHGTVHDQRLRMYDYTDQQYEALANLLAALSTVLPRIRLQYPQANTKLPDDVRNAHEGILGHYHVQTNKVDPGPAMQWERVCKRAAHLCTNL